MNKIESLLVLRRKIKEISPLVHCITNPISINGCANIVIACGAKPIMAEHPDEVYEITEKSSALLLNLGNITDVRMKSMRISAECANKLNIPVIADAVGVSCSSLRLEFLKDILSQYKVDIIKGNMSEIKALAGTEHSSCGIDVGDCDRINDLNLKESINICHDLATKYNTHVLATGKYDIIVSQNEAYTVRNGNANLSNTTGTGCMLGAMTAAFLSLKNPADSALLGAVLMGLAGENTEFRGPGSFLSDILDYIYSADDGDILENAVFYKESL